MTDQEAMLAYLHGDQKAFDLLFARHRGRVHSYISKRVRSPEETGEIFQEVFLKLHKSRYAYDPKHEFVKWLYVITRSVLIDHFRKQGKAPLPSETEAIDSKWDPSKGALENVVGFESLGAEQQRALKLRYEEDSRIQEIAKALEKTEPAVRKMLSRSLRFLRKKTSLEE